MSKSIHRLPTKEYYEKHILVIFQDTTNTLDIVFENLNVIKEKVGFIDYIKQKKLIKDLKTDLPQKKKIQFY